MHYGGNTVPRIHALRTAAVSHNGV